MNKRQELHSVIDSCDADIVVLTETWLSAMVRDNEIFYGSKRFNVYRCDREARSGGGVLIAITDALISFSVNVPCDLEIAWVCVVMNFKRCILGICYRPPQCSSSFVNKLHDAIHLVITRFPDSPIFLFGDFNFPNIVWLDHYPVPSLSSSQCSEFVKMCSDFNLRQLVNQPTRVTASSSSILDLVLTTCPDLVSPISYLSGLSDHSVLHFYFKVQRTKPVKNAKLIRDYSKANFAAINEELCVFMDSFLLNFDQRTVRYNWNLFKEIVHRLTNTYIPCHVIKYVVQSP